MMNRAIRAIGAPLDRIDGPKKVTGTATYSFEYPVEGVTYAFPVQSTIAKGRIVSIDTSAARALPGIVTVLSRAATSRQHSHTLPSRSTTPIPRRPTTTIRLNRMRRSRHGAMTASPFTTRTRVHTGSWTMSPRRSDSNPSACALFRPMSVVHSVPRPSPTHT